MAKTAIRFLMLFCMTAILAGCHETFAIIDRQQAEDLARHSVNPKQFALSAVYIPGDERAIRITGSTEENAVFFETEGDDKRYTAGMIDVGKGCHLVVMRSEISGNIINLLSLARISSSKIHFVQEVPDENVQKIRNQYGVKTAENGFPEFPSSSANAIVAYYKQIVSSGCAMKDGYIYEKSDPKLFVELPAYRKRSGEEEFAADYNAAQTDRERAVIAKLAIKFLDGNKMDDRNATYRSWLGKAAQTQVPPDPAAASHTPPSAPRPGLFPVGVNDLYGYLTPKGEWAIPPRFEAANPFAADGGAWVRFKGKYGRIDAKGEWAIQPKFDAVDSFAANGLAAARSNGKEGFINARGEWIIQPKFDDVGSFAADGLAAAQSNGKYGFINDTGAWAIQPKFDFVQNFSGNGLAWARSDGKHGFINATGEWVIQPKFDYAYSFAANGLAGASSNGKYGLINAKGEWVIQPKFDDVGSFDDNGLARADSNGKWGFINPRGEWVIQPKFDVVGSFAANGLTWARSNGKYGFINARGEWAVQPKFDVVGSFAANGLSAAKSNGKWGFINARGEWIIQPTFDGVGYFAANGLAGAKSNGKWGFINPRGEWVIQPTFDDVWGFAANGLAMAQSNGKRGFINAHGDFRVPLGYAANDEPDMRWEHEGDRRALTIGQASPVLYIESVCDTEVAKNPLDEIVWPRGKSVAQICEDKMAMDRYQQQKDAQAKAVREDAERKAQAARDAEERAARAARVEDNIRSCSHVYRGMNVYFSFFEQYTVERIMPERGEVVLVLLGGGQSSTWSCSSIPRD